MNELSAVLVSVSRLDSALAELDGKEKAILAERQKFDAECRRLEQLVNQLTTQHAAAVERQSAEETKLRDEQRKIVERRKQLTALGGSKSAKILEREVDVAGRSILMLETRVVGMLEESEKIDRSRSDAKNELDIKIVEKESLQATWQKLLAEIRENAASLKLARDERLKEFTPQMKQVYTRIATRYPGTAVSKAEGGSCRSCFRSLPAQVFNTVLSGKELVQCPGCSRILVSQELFDAAEAPAA